MDPSKVYGVTEECHSCESGWTMYIGSPFYGDNEEDDRSFTTYVQGSSHHNHRGYVGKGANPEDEDSDDSMASDASSKPCSIGVTRTPQFDQGSKKINKMEDGKKENQKTIKTKEKRSAKGFRDSYIHGKRN